MGEAYCRDACARERKAGTRCADCPAPTLLPECAPIVHAYLVCATQWRVGHNGRTGLDYAACQSATDAQRDRLGLPSWHDLLPDLQVIEHAILQCDAEHRERDAARRESERGK